MDTIRQYINSLFTNQPQTKETIAARQRLLQKAELQYQNYISQGLTPQQAIAKVISETNTTADELIIPEEPFIHTKQLLSDYRSASLYTALAVLFFIISILPYYYLEGLTALVLTVGCITAAVFSLFVQSYTINRHDNTTLTDSDIRYIQTQKDTEDKNILILKCISAAFLLFSILPTASLTGKGSFLITVLMIAIGAAIFTYAICEERMYRSLLHNSIRTIKVPPLLTILLFAGILFSIAFYQFWLTAILMIAVI
ncbi:MAG: hypothetical protein HUJ58_01145, partial [Erysipelotrichaceae bacterium]|nr:hypothetical protein [Erysipelotrichaceae bacterium]